MLRRIILALVTVLVCTGVAFAAPQKGKNIPATDKVERLSVIGVVTYVYPTEKCFDFRSDAGENLRVNLAPNVRFEQQYAHNVASYVGYATFDDLRVGDRVKLEHYSVTNSNTVADRVDIYR